MEVGESQPGPSLKEKVAAITKSFTMKNASDRKRKLRAKKNEEAGNPERMICFVKMNGFRVKSTSQKNGNGNQIHAQRAQSCPPASRGSDAFNENIEEMVVDDVPIVKSRASRADYQTSQTTWKNRMEAQDTRWKERRDEIFEESIKSSCINKGALCSLCQNQAFVRCQTCRYHLCSNCDKTIHTKQVTHQRKCEVNNCLHSLQSTEFLTNEGNLETLKVPLPMFVPDRCENCFGIGCIQSVASNTRTSLINHLGRFDCFSTVFECTKCNASRSPTVAEYVFSGYWPGSVTNENYFFEEQWLLLYYHIRHKTSGTSQQKIVEAIEEMSRHDDRINTINRVLFDRARKEFEFNRHTVKRKLLLRFLAGCKACGIDPLGHHADAIMKLYRFASAMDRAGESYYEDEIMVSDEEILFYINLIESRIPKAKGHAVCGGSTFKAGRTDASANKKLDITGLEMMSCTHGHVVRCANLFKGETYKHTHDQHLESLRLGAKFFCNDVIYKYWPFAVNVAKKFPERPEFSDAVTKQHWFLSRFHGRAHSWDCRVLHFGHWLPGAADFLGEEQEQVFATQGPRSNTSKHMSRSGRRDDISASLFYHNEEKDSKLPEYLVKCYHTALLRVPEYQMKLEKMMVERNITVENLDAILLSLKDRARQVRNKRSSSSWELGKLQLDLEGEAHMMQILKIKNEKCLDSSKARTRNRAEMSKKKARIVTLVKLLSLNYNVIVSEKDIELGIFPWHNGKSGSVAADYDLIDTWMLMKRYEEAIELNKKEMSMFLFSCERSINALNDEIRKREDDRRETYFPLSLIARSKDVAQATEILRLQKVIAEAREIFRQVQEGFRFEDEDYLDIVEKGQAEDILLEADDFDPALEEEDLIMGDCEIDEDDCCDWLNGEDCNFTTEYNDMSYV